MKYIIIIYISLFAYYFANIHNKIILDKSQWKCIQHDQKYQTDMIKTAIDECVIWGKT